MRSRISDLRSGLSSLRLCSGHAFGNSLLDVLVSGLGLVKAFAVNIGADECAARVGGLIRAGWESVVINFSTEGGRTMKRFAQIIVWCALFAVIAQAAFAQTFSVQGVLRDPMGKTVKDGYYRMTFRLYEQATGGTAVWEETQSSVQVLHGVYNAELGTATSLTSVPFDTTYYLGLSIEGGRELEPRFKLTRAPAAMSVQGTDNVFPSRGNIGAGTTAPTAGLHIVADPTVTNDLLIEDESGNPKLVVNDESHVGVGVAAPTATLHIKPATDADNNLLIEASNGDDMLVVTPDGKMGIGVDAPTAALHIQPATDANDKLLIEASNGDDMLVVTPDGKMGIGVDAPTAALHIKPATALSDNLLIQAATGDTQVVVTKDGKMGIGVGDPQHPLVVKGNLRLRNGGAIVFDDATQIASANFGGSATGVASPGNALITSDAEGLGTGEIQFSVHADPKMVIDHDGNVGIGTTDPKSKLHIAGDVKIDGTSMLVDQGDVYVQNKAGSGLYTAVLGYQSTSYAGLLFGKAGTRHAGFKWNGTNLILQDASAGSNPDLWTGTQIMTWDIENGNVGIGTTNPKSKLHIAGDVKIDGTSTLEFGAGIADKEINAGKIGYQIFTEDALDIVGAGTAGEANRKIKFWSEGGATFDGGITAAGRVGIGTTSPGAILHVKALDELLRLESTRATGAGYISFYDNSGTRKGYMGYGSGSAAEWMAIINQEAGELYFGTNGVTRMTIDTGGNVGINKTDPLFPLHVGGSAYYPIGKYGFLNNSTPTGTIGGGSVPVGGWFDGRVVSPEFNAISDVRVKNVIGVSNGSEDLTALKQLEVTDYTYIDVVGKGDAPHKKLIGQQTREVYPQAVNTGTDFIPNVYEMSVSTAYHDESKQLTITTDKKHGFSVGDQVRFIDESGHHEVKVLAVMDEHTFVVESDQASERVFVFGKQVDDFLSIDYEAISTLNVSATQELARQVQTLKEENAALKAEIGAVKSEMAKFASMMQRVEELEARVTALSPKQDGKVTVTASK